MDSAKTHFLDILGVEENYATVVSNRITFQRPTERQPFAQLISEGSKTVLRVGQVEYDNGVKIFVR